MRASFASSLLTGLLLATLPAVASVRSHRSTSEHASLKHVTVRSHHATAHAAVSHHAVAAMDTERATEIQTALIKSGYLSGEPTGTWDAQSAAAMQKLQADNGWQTKITPDSRALIKLGLGPQPVQ